MVDNRHPATTGSVCTRLWLNPAEIETIQSCWGQNVISQKYTFYVISSFFVWIFFPVDK